MEFNFSPKRVLLLIALLAIFAALGGFSHPATWPHADANPRSMTKAWFYCMLLFVCGATCVSLIDHFVGTLDRSNLRLLYVIIGVALMIGACLWVRGMRESFEPDQHHISHTGRIAIRRGALASLPEAADPKPQTRRYRVWNRGEDRLGYRLGRAACLL